MAREAHAKGARRKKISVEDKQPSSFPSLPGPKAVQSFLAKSLIWGFLLRYLNKSFIIIIIYINRKIDPSIYPIRFIF
jgi:hypothetical protein